MAHIRSYKDADYEGVVKVLKACDLFDKVWEDRKNLSRKIQKDQESIILAEEDGRVVGCVFLVDDGWNPFLFRLAVLPSHQRKGIGAELMRKAEETAKARGYQEISLFVDTANEHLKEWYSKQSYIKTKDYTFFYKKL